MLAVLLLTALGDGFDEVARPFLDAHCVRCHGPAAEQGGLDLASADRASVAGDPDLWDWLAERVETEEMPPPGEPAPGPEDRARFLEWLRAELGAPADAPQPLVGVPLRRLTRAEYESAARSLFDVSIDARRFLPEDRVGHGFDHVASAQTLSEADFLSYLDAAEAVAERAVPGDEVGPPRVRRFAPADMVGGISRGNAHWLTTRGVGGPAAPLPRAGEYLVRAEAVGQQAGPDPCRVRVVLGDDESEATFDVDATPGEAGVIVEARLRVDAGGDHIAGLRFLNDYYVARTEDRPAEDRNLAIRWVEVTGPLDDARPNAFSEGIVRRIDGADDPAAELRAIVRDLARVTWRTPEIAAEDLDRLLALSAPDEDPTARLRRAITGLLVSPRFLFKDEVGRAVAPDERGSVPLRGEEIATRLAGFLWSSVPDDALLARAAAGDLDAPAGVRAVAAEMLADPRADAFAEGFGEQWLQLRPVAGGKRADRGSYPRFSGRLARSMREETRRVLVDSMRGRRDLWDLVDGDETFVDARLAALYEVGDDATLSDAGDGWRRVTLASTPRRGLIGHASVLFATSESTRTSPVRRGKWILEVLLGSAPPPPPPGADNLPEAKGEDAALSLRERFERHRADPSCAACHARMDPLGFGLEAYDGIGALRAADDPERGDVSGVLPDGRSFEGPLELVGILRDEERFLEAFVERVLVYALARGLERADRGAVAAVLEDLEGAGIPTIEGTILALVTTDEVLRTPATGRGDGR
ncbi:MAG: DUF1588 domain-containing protein [Planctomycetota bacterium]